MRGEWLSFHSGRGSSCLMRDQGAVFLFVFPFLVSLYTPWHSSPLQIDFLCTSRKGHTMYTRLPTQHILWARNGIRKKDYIFSIWDWSATLKFWFQVPHLPPRNKLWHPAWARSLPCQIWYGRGKPMEKKLCVLRRAKHCVWVGCGTFSVSTCITRQINLCLGFPLLSIAFNDLFLLGTVF